MFLHLAVVSSEYEEYDLNMLCSGSGELVHLYLGRQEARFRLFGPHKGISNCRIRTRTFSNFYGQSVFINKMPSDSCDQDYIQFGR